MEFCRLLQPDGVTPGRWMDTLTRRELENVAAGLSTRGNQCTPSDDFTPIRRAIAARLLRDLAS